MRWNSSHDCLKFLLLNSLSIPYNGVEPIYVSNRIDVSKQMMDFSSLSKVLRRFKSGSLMPLATFVYEIQPPQMHQSPSVGWPG